MGVFRNGTQRFMSVGEAVGQGDEDWAVLPPFPRAFGLCHELLRLVGVDVCLLAFAQYEENLRMTELEEEDCGERAERAQKSAELERGKAHDATHRT